MNHKQAALTNEVSRESVVNLFNPFSGMLGYNTWAPKSFTRASNAMGSEIAWKGLTGLGIAAAVAALLRGVSAGEERKNPYAGFRNSSKMDTTAVPVFDADTIRKLRGTEKAKKASWTEDLIQGVVPAAAVVTGGALGYKAVDKFMESRHKDTLTESIAVRSDLLKRLQAARALHVRGQLDQGVLNRLLNESAPYFKEEDSLNKVSSEKKAEDKHQGTLNTVWRTGTGSVGLVLAALIAGTAYATKKWADENDPARIKFKAYTKGLEQYAKNKYLPAPLYQPLSAAPNQEEANKLIGEHPEEQVKKPVPSITEVPTNMVSII